MQNLTLPYSPAALGETIVPVETNGGERGGFPVPFFEYCPILQADSREA